MRPADIRIGHTYNVKPGIYDASIRTWFVSAISTKGHLKTPWLYGHDNNGVPGAMRPRDLSEETA